MTEQGIFGSISVGCFSEVPEWMGLENSQDDPTIVGLTAQVTIFQVQGENGRCLQSFCPEIRLDAVPVHGRPAALPSHWKSAVC